MELYKFKYEKHIKENTTEQIVQPCQTQAHTASPQCHQFLSIRAINKGHSQTIGPETKSQIASMCQEN